MPGKTFQEIVESAHKLAESIGTVSGLKNIDINFGPGTEKSDIDLNYNFSSKYSGNSFPYNNRLHVGVIENYFTWRNDPWWNSLIERYQYHFDTSGHSVMFEHKCSNSRLNFATTLKYSRRWIDMNVKENCWSAACKLIYDFNKESIVFKNNASILKPNIMFAKIFHKSRKNYVDTERCSSEMLKSALYPDSLLGLKIGHKNIGKIYGMDVKAKTWAEIGYNGTDSPFAKLKGYFHNSYNILNKNIMVLNQSILFEKLFAKGAIRINDSPFIRGFKGIYDFPGAKSYRGIMVPPGKEHDGDRVPNSLIAQYEAKLMFPSIDPFLSFSIPQAQFFPYIYGALGYSQPIEGKYNNESGLIGSTGFGLTYQLRLIAIHFYYSVAAYTQNNNAKKEYGFIIGFD